MYNYSILILRAYIDQNKKLIQENKKRISKEFFITNKNKYEKLNEVYQSNIADLQKSIELLTKNQTNEETIGRK